MHWRALLQDPFVEVELLDLPGCSWLVPKEASLSVTARKRRNPPS